MEITTYFDEMLGRDGEKTRHAYQLYSEWYKSEDATRLRKKQKEAERLFRLTGITFNVYGDEKAEERLIPFDIVLHGGSTVGPATLSGLASLAGSKITHGKQTAAARAKAKRRAEVVVSSCINSDR
ncbi:MAG: hypothetical protein EB086_10455 [Rhodobacteraceae bacterium]|nr:hypothetical protein [Paracoccaceae bacterium]